MTEVRYYLDENLETEIAVQLKKRGIDAIHIRDLNCVATLTKHILNAHLG